jgi:hypothetical protein
VKALAAGCVVAILAIIGVGFGILVRAGQTCTVGIAGTDLQVTATGAGAPDFCTSFINNSDGHGIRIDKPGDSGTLQCLYKVGRSRALNGFNVFVRGTAQAAAEECDALGRRPDAKAPPYP